MSEVPKEIKKISDFEWELPTSYKKGMIVPARIIANEALLNGMDKGVFDQVTNIACLPGIQKRALCMPDGHWGYGFPIGGVAAFDANEGIISPGGIGFDINCLSGDSKIALGYGCYKKIEDMEKDFKNLDVSLFDLSNHKKKNSEISLFLKKYPTNKVFNIKTKCGNELVLTEDHPVYTDNGMVEAKYLEKGKNLISHPFEGVEYETPSSKIIVSEEDIISCVGNRTKLIKTLKEKNLLPLRENSKHLPILTKLLGFATGDGWLGKYYNKKRKQEVWSFRIITDKEDLLEIQEDIKKLGYIANYIGTNNHKSVLNNLDGTTRKIEGESSQLVVNSQSLAVLLHVLGVPEGNKSRKGFRVPEWVFKAPLWIKRLYLAGLFGAELTAPAQRKNENLGFLEPSFSQNKIENLEWENRLFIGDITKLLNIFNVKVNNVYKQKGVINSFGEITSKLSLRISTKMDNLINLWGKIGYEYCIKRKKESMLALAFLKMKKQHLLHCSNFVDATNEMLSEGSAVPEILIFADKEGISRAMVKGKIYSESKTSRVSSNFPKYCDFVSDVSFENSELVKDEIMEIEEVFHLDWVYDFTVSDKDHNFVANSLVTHNCGMRLITTNLSYKEVKPQLKNLVDNLFTTVPSGVGCKGFLKLNNQQFDDIMVDGVKWCVENGYGVESDVWNTEGYGKIEQADVEKVSERARKRGINQLGTLGSGNHYLEIQLAKSMNVFDEDVAKKFGIIGDDQVVIMVHCGSRGFGHQVATDYLKIFDKSMDKYGIKVNDRELACAPFNSDEGQDYYKAMACASNMAFANRQVITHRIREAFSSIFKKTQEQMEMNLVYDVAHNIAKVEDHKIDGKMKKLVVHRKGATRAFPPKHRDLCPKYRSVGQPVILGGSMETGSHLLVGTQKAMDETFGSTAHGSGRTMSRTKAKQEFQGKELQEKMLKKGIYVRSSSMNGLAEEAGSAYKDINSVVDILDTYGIARKVVGFNPIGNVKGHASVSYLGLLPFLVLLFVLLMHLVV